MSQPTHPLRNVVKRLLGPVLKPVASWYSSKSRTWDYLGAKAVVLPDVFHPGLFLSTKILARYLNSLELTNKTVLELGCGSGFLSAFVATKGAVAAASDINPAAVENAKANASLNEVSVETIESDLFKNLQGRQFDVLVINPPYYPQAPSNVAEHAWFCGPEFEYFQRLFAELPGHIAASGQALMILSEDCALDQIESIAKEHGRAMREVHRERRLLEWNYIFCVE